METIQIDATTRTRTSKGEVRLARRRGKVLGAVFGRGVDPFLVEVTARDIVKVLSSEGGLNTLIDLGIPDQARRTVIISELERDAITRGFLHVGFHNLNKSEKLHTSLPIRLIGEPEPVRLHEGVLDQTLETIEVKADPADLPSHLDVDISHLKIGDNIHVSDLPNDPKIEILTAGDVAIATVQAERTFVEPETNVEAQEAVAADTTA